MAQSELERTLETQIKQVGLPDPVQEFHFAKHLGRRYRADFAYPQFGLLIEVEGGTWTRGRHTRGGGFEKDCEKYNLAAELGYKVLRFTGAMVEDGRAITTIEKMIRWVDETVYK
jgi:very-short-patch-repair endonuclease